MDRPPITSFFNQTPTQTATPGARPPLSSFSKNSDTFPKQEPPAVKQSFMSKLIDPLKGGVQNVKDISAGVGHSFSDAAHQTQQDFNQAATGDKPAFGAGFQAVGNFSKAIISPLTETAGAFVNDTANTLSQNKGFQGFANSKVGDALSKANIPMDKYSEWAQQHPEASKNLEALGNIAALGTSVPAGGEVGAMAKTGLDTSADLVKPGLNKLKTGVVNVADKTVGKSAMASDLAKADIKPINKIQEIISPKITSKETQAIINEGRLTRGNDSLLFGKQPDIVAQSEAVQKSARTIHETIPNAAKMNDAQLSTALDSKIGETAKTLKPQMDLTPLKPETIKNVQSTWQSLKAEQQARPEFLDNKAGNTAFQNKFENYLEQVKNGKSMNDVWDPRKTYDASVPSNIKNATNDSPPQFQVRKAMWLENRAILNSAINDTATGLGETSQKAFSQMSDMYNAKQNILSKAKIDTKGSPGPLSAKTLKKAAIGTAITAAGLGGAKSLLGH